MDGESYDTMTDGLLVRSRLDSWVLDTDLILA